LSPTVLTLAFVATIGLLLTPDLGMIECTFKHDAIVVTFLFFDTMTLFGDKGVPQDFDFSPTILT